MKLNSIINLRVIQENFSHLLNIFGGVFLQFEYLDSITIFLFYFFHKS